ncbi:unnamed protein product, partial [Peniophora sp. CBMAI 1063]
MALEAQPPPMSGLPRETPIDLTTDDDEQPKPGTPGAAFPPPQAAYPYPLPYYAPYPPPPGQPFPMHHPYPGYYPYPPPPPDLNGGHPYPP